MNAATLWVMLGAVAACSSRSGGPRETFATQVYAPPVPGVVRCPAGVPATLAPEWHSMKNDDRISAAQVYVHLDAAPHTCTVGIGEFPRLCKKSDGWTTTCTNRDGSRPHVGQIRCTADALEVWVIAPEGEVRVAHLPRPPGSAPCNGT